MDEANVTTDVGPATVPLLLEEHLFLKNNEGDVNEYAIGGKDRALEGGGKHVDSVT